MSIDNTTGARVLGCYSVSRPKTVTNYTRVVRPVVYVRYPVPTPVPYTVNVPYPVRVNGFQGRRFQQGGFGYNGGFNGYNGGFNNGGAFGAVGQGLGGVGALGGGVINGVGALDGGKLQMSQSYRQISSNQRLAPNNRQSRRRQ